MKRLFQHLFGIKNTTRQAASRRPRFEALEDRNFLAGDLVEAETLQPGGLPALHSNPGASKTLYLNFTGNTILEDYDAEIANLKGLVTYAFDLDGQAGDFSALEQQTIRAITRIVAEDFAPFDIDVTTDYFGTFDDGEELQVAIGGTDRDQLFTTGISPFLRGAFNNEAPNTVLVVPTNMGQRPLVENLKEKITIIGNTASHEAGHAFGLEHHHNLAVEDTGSEEYRYHNGTEVWSPIMGQNVQIDRSTWSHATIGGTEAAPELQDGISILTTVLGLRADDHGNNSGLATPLTDVDPGLKMEGSGIIGKLDDVDFFSFRGQYSGDYKVFVNVPGYGNLDARLAVYTDAGEVVDDGEGLLDAKATVWLQADTDYFFSVTSHGTYGDLGRYDIAVLWVVPDIGLMPVEPELPSIPDPGPYDPSEWRDPSEYYDSAANIWINPEFVFDPAESFWSDPEQVYDPATIWDNPEQLFDPGMGEVLEGIAEQVYEPAADIWSNPEQVYDPAMEEALDSIAEQIYDPATDIWSNPELVFEPAMEEVLEPIAEQVYDPAAEIWANSENIYSEILEPEVTEYIPTETVYEANESIWNSLAVVAEPVAPLAQPAPIITAVLADAVFSNYSAVKAMRKIWF